MTIVKKLKKVEKGSDDWIVVKKNEFFSLEKNRFNFDKRRVIFCNDLKVLEGESEFSVFLLAYGKDETDLLGDYTIFNERFLPTLKTFYENGMKMEKFMFSSSLDGFRLRREAKMENFKEYQESYFTEYDGKGKVVDIDSSDEEMKEAEVEMEAENGERSEDEVACFFNTNLGAIKHHMDSYYDFISRVKKIVTDFKTDERSVSKGDLYSVEGVMEGVIKAGGIIETFMEKLKKEKSRMNKEQSGTFKKLSKHFGQMKREATYLHNCKDMKKLRAAAEVRRANEVPNFMEKRIRASEKKKLKERQREVERFGGGHEFFNESQQQQQQAQMEGKKMRLLSTHAATMDAHMQEQRETNKDLMQVSEEMNELQDLMNDLRKMTYTQQDHIDLIEERVERSNLNVQRGREQVRKARQQQRLGTRRAGCLVQ